MDMNATALDYNRHTSFLLTIWCKQNIQFIVFTRTALLSDKIKTERVSH